jgi:large subunit ribosomal protein L4
MTALPVLNAEGVPAGEGPLAGPIAEQAIKPHLIHETVVGEMAGRRAGTHSTKTRAEARGGGRKPWRQKGTGRARAGSVRSPLWRGGGVAFGPTPRDHSKKVNRRVRAQAFRSALRAHAERGSLAIMDATGWEDPSTKRASAYLYQAPEGLAARPLLVVVADAGGVEARSFRNLSGVFVLEAREVEVVDLMAGRSLLVERSVWERYAGAELEVTSTDATPKAPPAKKKPKPAPRRRKKVEEPAPAEETVDAAEEAEAAEATEAEVEETAEAVTDTEPDADAAEEPEAEEPEAEEAAEPEGDEAPEPDEEPAAEAEAAVEVAPEPEVEEAPAPEPAVEEKPKRTRRKKPPAEEAEAPTEAEGGEPS